MSRFVAGVDIDRVYTFDEIMEMYHRGRLKEIALVGYVSRANADGTVQFVPFTESTAFRGRNEDLIQEPWDVGAMREEVERENPISRRTPQQRVASMMIRIMTDIKRSGGFFGLTEEQVRTITGEAWKEGETEITTDMVRSVAAHFLGVAEKANREADRKRPTRLHPTA